VLLVAEDVMKLLEKDLEEKVDFLVIKVHELSIKMNEIENRVFAWDKRMWMLVLALIGAVIGVKLI